MFGGEELALHDIELAHIAVVRLCAPHSTRHLHPPMTSLHAVTPLGEGLGDGRNRVGEVGDIGELQSVCGSVGAFGFGCGLALGRLHATDDNVAAAKLSNSLLRLEAGALANGEHRDD